MQQNHTTGVGQAIEQLRLRHFLLYAGLQMIGMLTIWNFLAGAVFLVLRQSRVIFASFPALSLAGIPIAMLLAVIVATRRTVPRQKALAIIDSFNNAGGLLLAECETGDTSWTDRQPQDCKIPAFKADFAGRLPALLFSVFFLLLCLYIPVNSRFNRVDPRMELKEIEKTTAGQIEILTEEGVLSEEMSADLRNTLEQISADSNRNDPAGTFESLDQLQEKLKNVATANVGKMLAELEKLHNQQEEQARQALQAFDKSAEGAKGSDAAALQAEKELKEYIKKQAEEIRKAAEKMLNAKLIDQKTFEKLLKEGKIRPATEKDLQENPDAELIVAPSQQGQCEGGAEQGLGAGEDGSGESGDGGVSRGGSTAPLNYNRRTSEHNIGFRDESLPAPKEQNLESSVSIGMSLSAPTSEPVDNISSLPSIPAWQKPAKSTDESVIILPRHRNAVKNYFEHTNP